MISDEITDNLIYLLNVSCKNIISISICIASQKIKRGENKATHAFTTNSRQKLIFLRCTYDLLSAGTGAYVRSRMHVVSQESRDFCFQDTIFCQG